MSLALTDIKPKRFAKVTIAKSFRTEKQASITGDPVNVLVPKESFECHGYLHTDGNDVVVVPVGGGDKNCWRSNINNVTALEYLE